METRLLLADDALTGASVGELASGDLHVWCVSLQALGPVERWRRTLDLEERARAGRYHFERDRDLFIIGRGVLRTILSGYLQCEPTDLDFSYGSSGKPALAGAFAVSPLRFNLSHSAGLALYAVTLNREIGIDIEYNRSTLVVESLVERYFSEREAAAFRVLPADKRRQAFFRSWTCKEACLKATGDGLTAPLDRVEVGFDGDGAARLLAIDGDKKAAARWSLRELQPAFNYAAALAVQGPLGRLLWRRWPQPSNQPD